MESVLIVDDNADLRELFSIVLAKSGYRVSTAPGGNECISFIAEKLPDLILLDIMMEPVDGWDTLARIRSNPMTRDLPVIMVTGKQPTEEEIQRHLSEIDGYVVKPITIHELTDLVKTFFQFRQHINRELQAFCQSVASEILSDEYQKLCRLLAAGFLLSKIMPEYKENIDQTMKRTRDRLHAIHHDCHLESESDVFGDLSAIKDHICTADGKNPSGD